MTEPAVPAVLAPELAARLGDFARTCKAAARAVSLYPAGHPAIESTLSRLAAASVQLTERGPYRLQIVNDRILVDGAAAVRPDTAIGELAVLLHRHFIGTLVVNAGAGADSWRTLLLLLARPPDEVRADGGIAHLWATAGGPSLELQEVDYAEVLRDRQGAAATIEAVMAAALAGPTMDLDDTSLRALLDVISDPVKLEALMAEVERAAERHGPEAPATAFLTVLRDLTQFLMRTAPDEVGALFQKMGRAAGKLSAASMLALLARRAEPDAVASDVNVVTAVVDAMGDETVADFVAGSVIAERGASERLAHAFSALVPEIDRQRQLLGLAEQRVEASALGSEDGFPELWQRVEGMLTSYSDASFVSSDYARELENARVQPLDVEHTSDDPPERIAAWLATVNDGALRALDRTLLSDLLVIEPDPLRWRDIADTVVTHADDLVRVGYFDQAWQLVEAVADHGLSHDGRKAHAAGALERFGRGAMMKHVATHLRGADEDAYARFTRLCHAIGPPIIAPLAEVLSAEQDARSRRRLRDVLLGFGSRGRESVQQLMHAQNWEVRRTAAYLLREFGGAEGLSELIPLLTDPEPLVQREAVQGLVLNGSAEAAAILARAAAGAAGRARETLVTELLAIRDERAAPLFCHLLRRLDRRAFPQVYLTILEALGGSKSEEAVQALAFALEHGEWWTFLANRRFRGAAAQSLRRIGTPQALEALKTIASRGPAGARAAARAQLAGMD